MGKFKNKYNHLYGRKWRKLREAFLKRNPLCVMCHENEFIEPSIVVDHIVPHRGDPKLFFDEDNLQPLCKNCHDSAKQKYERSGVVVGADASGVPLDPNHHWR